MSTRKTIHILGIGNIGLLFAHSLLQLPTVSRPLVTLLLRSQAQRAQWEDAARAIEWTSNGTVTRHSSGVEVEDVHSANGYIENLIVSTKASRTLEALGPLRQRLGAKSTLVLAQNGMGVVDDLETIFEDKKDRPSVLGCVISHGVYSLGPFKSVHAGHGSVFIGPVTLSSDSKTPNNSDSEATSKTLTGPFDEEVSHSQRLLETILAAQTLNARPIGADELLLQQLSKLVVNAVINPLTAIYGVTNGELFNNSPILSPSTTARYGLTANDLPILINDLINEAGTVIRAYLGTRDLKDTRFSKASLLQSVKNVASLTAHNRSSMLQDVSAGRETEIEYINGWIVREGRKMGVAMPANEKMVELIRSRMGG